MKRIQRLEQIKSKLIYNPKNCKVCFGSGRDPTIKGKRNGCATCLVGPMFQKISTKDANWLFKLAANGLK